VQGREAKGREGIGRDGREKRQGKGMRESGEMPSKL